jgi:hypothetical protein
VNDILFWVALYVGIGYLFTLFFLRILLQKWDRTPGTAFLVHLIWPIYLVICVVFGICAGVWWLWGRGIWRFLEIIYFLPKIEFDNDE